MIAIGIPAIDSIDTAGARSTRSSRITLRTLATVSTRRTHWTVGAGRACGTHRPLRPLRTHHTLEAHRAHRPHRTDRARMSLCPFRTLGSSGVDLNFPLLALCALNDVALGIKAKDERAGTSRRHPATAHEYAQHKREPRTTDSRHHLFLSSFSLELQAPAVELR